MENDFFLNAAALHFEPSSSSSPSMPTWHSLSSSSAMDIPVSSEQPQQQEDCFYNPTWKKSTMDHFQQQQQHDALQFDSALSSMVSSPAASNSNLSNDNFIIRELIGKLGNIGNSGEISSYMNGTNSANTSCYSTPLSSPPKLNVPHPLMNNNNNQLIKDKLPMALNSCVAEFSADPGFAERAAKFSCFGSRSFNGRSSRQVGMNNNTDFTRRSSPLVENGKLSRVSSSPSLKALGSQMESKNSPLSSQEESTISEQNPNGEPGVKPSHPDMNSRKRKASSKGKSKENPPKAAEANEDSSAKRRKPNEGEGHELKAEEESKGGNKNGGDEIQSKSNNPKPPELPKDYIHVRARRGQATDSHSLAERVRREKISERMKLLQDLVPGCTKVTGKALMLDEIINYVQLLQRQVEFLSMKLASVNTRLDVSIDNLISKDIFQSNDSLAHQAAIFPLDSSATAFYGPNPAIHNTIPNGTVPHSMESLDSAFCQSLGFQLPPLNGFNEGASQYPMTFCEEDLHAMVQMGFGQTENGKTPTQSPSFNGFNAGSNQIPHMKVEL